MNLIAKAVIMVFAIALMAYLAVAANAYQSQTNSSMPSSTNLVQSNVTSLISTSPAYKNFSQNKLLSLGTPSYFFNAYVGKWWGFTCTPAGCALRDIARTLIFSKYYLPIIPITSPISYTVSPTNTVNSYNLINAAWFITCPQAPEQNPTNPQYFYTGSASYIAGDACQAKPFYLLTALELYTRFSSITDIFNLIHATVNPLQITNAVRLYITELAYSPQVNGNISSSFSSQSYAFQNSPTFIQHAIWTWHAYYANLGSAVTNIASFDSGTYIPWLYLGYCVFTYSYFVNTELTKVANGYIPFNEIVGQNKYNEFKSNILPYFLFHYSIQSYTDGSTVQSMSEAYDIYDPYTYFTPFNSIDMFPIASNSFFYSGYGSGSDFRLVSVNRQGVGINMLEMSSITANPGYSNVMIMGSNPTPSSSSSFLNWRYWWNKFGLSANTSGSNISQYGQGTLPQVIFKSILNQQSILASAPPAASCPTTQYTPGVPAQISVAQATACANSAGFSGTSAEIMVAIAQAESSLNPGAENFNGGYCTSGTFKGKPNTDRGIVQINNCYQPSVSDACAYTPGCAFQSAYTISSSGTNFNPWCTYAPALPNQGCGTSPASVVGPYCKYMPSTYSGPHCVQGGASPSPAQVAAVSSPMYSNLPDPISIAATPNDYLYVLNKQSSDYYLTIFQIIPQGYYDLSNYPPTSVGNSVICNEGTGGSGSTTSCDKVFLNNWEKYWMNVIKIQRQTTMYVKSIDLTQAFQGTSVSNYFTPINISVDNNGDVFIVGDYYSSGNRPMMAKVSNPLSASPQYTSNEICWSNSGSPGQCDSVPNPSFGYFTEVAASPTGRLAFVASPQSGYIYVINGSALYYYSQIPLSFSAPNSVKYGIDLNINTFLADKGLYGASIPWLSQYETKPYLNYDLAAFHHPLGIADVNGYVYVLDAWGGELGSDSQQGVYFNMLLLRAINSTGSNIPVNPIFQNDLYNQNVCQTPTYATSTCYGVGDPYPTCPQSGCTAVGTGWCASSYNYFFIGRHATCVSSTNPSSQIANHTLAVASTFSTPIYPPYGWIMSANISAIDSSGNLQDSVSFCSSTSGNQKTPSCTYSPSNMPSGYSGSFLPIGPAIGGYNLPFSPGLSFSMNFNNTATILFMPTPTSGFWSNVWGDIKSLYSWLKNFFGGSTTKASTLNQQGELIIARFNVENYTKSISGTQPYVCYLGTASKGSSTGCQIADITPVLPPVYTFANPFRYLESRGVIKEFISYIGNFYSTFTNGAGAPKGNYACANAYAGSGSGCTQQKSPSAAASSITSTISGTSTSPAPSNPYATQETLTSYVSGQIIEPYTYSYKLTQTWNNFYLETCLVQSIPIVGQALCSLCYTYPLAVPLTSGQPVSYNGYGSYVSNPVQSNTKIANLEGGRLFFSFQNMENNGYFMPNLTDVGTILSPEILWILRSDRNVSGIYINVTPWGLGFSNTAQYVLNAMHRLNYAIVYYMQPGALAGGKSISGLSVPAGAYETIKTSPVSPPEYGKTAFMHDICGGGTPGLGYLCRINPSLFLDYASANTYLSYVPNEALNSVRLFAFYKQVPQADLLDFVLSGSTYSTPLQFSLLQGALRGYVRLIYVISDRFNNSVYVPVDADIANITSIQLNLNPQISPSNPNETTIQISGTAGYSSDLGTLFTPLANSYIYLYYGGDINYAGFDPTLQSSNNGIVNALQCAFGKVSNPSQCVLSDPTYTGRTTYAGTINYASSFISPGTCQQPPSTLFSVANTMCNIYGTDGVNKNLPETCPPTVLGSEQYCLPLYSNGTGVCTSQLGLMAIVKTDVNGNFNYNVNACGIGNAKIIAKFYGSPSGQPQQVTQASLGTSADPNAGSTSPVTFNVLNYQWAPNETSSSVPIGMFELSYGVISAVGIAAALIIAIIALGYMYRAHIRKDYKHGKKKAG